MPDTIAEQYLFAVDSFIEFARTLQPDDWETVVPCTPAWTARDVLSHVSGIPDDAAAGRMAGAPGEAWTAAQVERNRSFGVDQLLERWRQQAPVFAAAIEQMGEGRPPIDCHSHEHDLRHALSRPGNRSNLVIDTQGAEFALVGDAGVTVVVEFDDGRASTSGEGEQVALHGMTPFEVFRSRLGRRSRAQVRGYDWSGDSDAVDAVVERWFVFGPAAAPIEE